MRRGKSKESQEKYYEVNDFYSYMIDTYICGNIGSFVSLYRELDRPSKEGFIDYLIEELELGVVTKSKTSEMLIKCLVR